MRCLLPLRLLLSVEFLHVKYSTQVSHDETQNFIQDETVQFNGCAFQSP